MIIKIYDDKKEKSQSFEATLSIDLTPITSYNPISETGYGATQQEAIEDLRSKITKFVTALQSIDYSKTVVVARGGNTISETYS